MDVYYAQRGDRRFETRHPMFVRVDAVVIGVTLIRLRFLRETYQRFQRGTHDRRGRVL
jgi:hypothetical protein